jgi:hypothetical protein
MQTFNEFLLTEAGVPGPEIPVYRFKNNKVVFQSLPMRDMSEQGMSNLVRYLEEAGQKVQHDTERNCTKLWLSTKALGESCLCLNYNGTWHFERHAE